jgi:hypothetical protein
VEGDRNAVRINPENAPPGAIPGGRAEQEGEKAALDIKRYWGRGGAHLTVGFIETPDRELRARILAHLNAWSEHANVSFTEVETDPQVRIARWTAAEAPPGESGYWSALGTDILGVAPGVPTMNLEAFTMRTSEEEFRRVVRHEAGHTLGFPHEHLRAELVSRLSRERVIAAFMRSQGWSPPSSARRRQMKPPSCVTTSPGASRSMGSLSSAASISPRSITTSQRLSTPRGVPHREHLSCAADRD